MAEDLSERDSSRRRDCCNRSQPRDGQQRPYSPCRGERHKGGSCALGTFDLSDCEIFTSCEPCPMCLGAIYWARLKKVYFANNKTDAKNIGFDDSFIYDELALPREGRKLSSEEMMRNEAIKAFEMWAQKDDKIEY